MIGKGLFVTAIDTDIGKTIISSILVKRYNCNYWKPVQCGLLPQTDTQTVRQLTNTTCFKEQYCFKTPCSPHKAAQIENIEIDINTIKLPYSSKRLIVEGAGGIMVPLNKQKFMIDLIKKLELETIIVSKNYLGSLNHTFSTITLLKNYQIPIKGLIFNGEQDTELENFISTTSKVNILARIQKIPQINERQIQKLASTV
jgi:dethiobiotin synthetase